MRALYFSARFKVIDAFFRFRIGNAVFVESPNGDIERVPLVDGVFEVDERINSTSSLTGGVGWTR